MQRLEIIGHLGADAEVKAVQGGSQFVAFRVACSQKFNDKEVTQWYDCTLSDPNMKVVQYLKTGTRVFVRGIPSYRIFDSAKYHMRFVGVNVHVLEVQLCSDKKEDQESAQAPAETQEPKRKNSAKPNKKTEEGVGELPF